MPVATIRRQPPGVGATPDLRTPAPHSHLALVPASPSDSERTARTPQEAFCTRLRLARERRGIPLKAVAETTKVTASLFQALERGDVSRWPKGIYKRSFFRGYVAAIGLPVEASTEEFLRLFPDETPPDVAVPADAGKSSAPSEPLRLTLAPAAGRVPFHRRLSRSAVADAMTVLVSVLGLAWWAGLDAGTATAFSALAFYPQLAPIVRKRAAARKAASAAARPADAEESAGKPDAATVGAT